MRILHTSDLHLGRQFNGLSLENDHQVILDQIVMAMLEYLPDALVIAGDIFDRAAPPASSVKQFNTFLTEVVNRTSAAVILIAGNHDSGDRISSMGVLTDARRALIRGSVSAEEPHLLLEDKYGPVAISALPFAYEYAARDCFGNDQITKPEDVLKFQIAAARSRLPAGARWVVTAHGFVAGATSSDSERSLVRVGGVELVSADVFEGANYVALGHLHRPQVAGKEHIRYAGAPLAFGFDEANDTKSMNLVEIDASGQAEIHAIPFTPRRKVRVLRGKLAELLVEKPSDDIVRAILTDQEPLIDPMKRLRDVYPNTCQLSFARDEQVPEKELAPAAIAKINEPIFVIGEFLEYVRDKGLAEIEAELIKSTLHELRSEEDRA